MNVKVNCPVCGIRISMRVKDTASPVKCLTCGCSFIAVEDCGITCPKCDSVVIIPPGGPKNRVSCISCGFTFGESWLQHYSLWLLLAGVWGYVLLFCFLTCLSGLLKAQRCHMRDIPNDSRRSVGPGEAGSRRSVSSGETVKIPFWRLWKRYEIESEMSGVR